MFFACNILNFKMLNWRKSWLCNWWLAINVFVPSFNMNSTAEDKNWWVSSIDINVRETYSLDLKHKKNAIDIPVANITCVIVAAIDVLTCIMWLIISKVQGMRVRWAGAGNFDASSLTAFKILSSNAVQHWTNLVTIPYCTLDIIDGIDRTLHLSS